MAQWDWITYLLFFAVISFGYFCLNQYDLRREGKGIEWLVLGIIPGALLLALRCGEAGKDLLQYERHILNFYSYKITDLFSEPLMNFVEGISAKAGGLHFFIVFTSLIEFYFIFTALKKLHSKGMKTKLVYVMFYSFVVIRSTSMVSNGLGLVCAFCAITHLIPSEDSDENSIRKDKISFFIYTFIGIMFHNSIWVNIPLYFFCRPYNPEKTYRRYVIEKAMILISLVIVLFIYSRGGFDRIVLMLLGKEYNRFLSVSSAPSFGFGNIISRLPVLFLTFFYWKDIVNSYGKRCESIKYLIILDMVLAQMRYVSTDFERLTMLTGIGTIILVPLLYDVLKNKWRGVLQLVLPLGIAGYLAYYLYIWGVVNAYGIMPYKFW